MRERERIAQRSRQPPPAPIVGVRERDRMGPARRPRGEFRLALRKEAATPSPKSWVCVSSACVTASSSSCSANVAVSARSSRRFVCQTARVGIACEQARDPPARGARARRRRRPRSRGPSFEPPRLRGGALSSAIRTPAPSRADGARAKSPPESGTSPILMNAGTKLAESATTLTSQASASDMPAPAAGPLTAAMTGFSSARIASTLRW